MPPAERDRSKSPALSHKHSASDLAKSSVPMWDSSDPDRAPPPLPLNPASPITSPTKHGTSETVAAAARALAERARQNAGPSPYTVNAIPPRSPEKSPTRTPQHKRLQSLQQTGRRESKVTPEPTPSLEPSTTRAAALTTTSRDVLSSSPEHLSPTPDRATSPSGNDALRDSTNQKRSPRTGHRPIFGENSPPSATMLAIQNMPHRDFESVLGNAGNISGLKSPQSLDSIYSQMQNLTIIATTLQKEMNALSRRSKDNATDLVSLKEATKTRDEDIRKSLRELITTAKTTEINTSTRSDMSRSTSAMDFAPPRFLDTKPFHSPPFAKSVSLPRIPAIHGQDGVSEFDRATSPSPYSADGAATVAMLEKILREMGTKEGQENLLSTLSELLDKSTKENSDVSRKVEELLKSVRESQISTALVKHEKSRRLSNDSSSLSPARSAMVSSPIPPSHIVSDELRQVLQKIKDSAAQGGGLTAEVKAQVRELRGEVLGMGRELGRKIDKAGDASQPIHADRSLVLADDRPGKHDLEKIIKQGLGELKEQMDRVIQTARRQSSGSSRLGHSLDSSEVQSIIRQSLAEHAMERSTAVELKQPPFDQEALITAVKQAYDDCKPEIELQQFGLERDEILQCLKEGLDEYRASRDSSSTISRDEVLAAVHEGLQHFTPPAPVTEASELKEEILESVRECLNNFQPPAPQRTEWQPGDISKDEILDAVREGLGNFKKEGAREIEINRDDLFQAVKAGLDNTQTPFGGYGDEVLQSLHDIVEGMRVEFKEYSAANGRDTEMVLDTTKDGLESLRVQIESYVDRCRDVTGKDEIIQTLRSGVNNIQGTVDKFVANNYDIASVRSQLVEYIKCEFEHLRDTVLSSTTSNKDELLEAIQNSNDGSAMRSTDRGLETDSQEHTVNLMREELQRFRDSIHSSVMPAHASSNNVDLLEAIRDGLDGLKASNERGLNPDDTTETLDDIKDELEQLRQSLTSTLMPKDSNADNSEILIAMQAGFDNLQNIIGSSLTTADRSGSFDSDTTSALQEGLRDLRAEINRMSDKPVDVDMTVSYDILDTLKDGINGIRQDIERLKGGSIMTPDGEVILSEGTQAQAALKKTDFDRLEVILTRLQIKVEAMDQNMQANTPMNGANNDMATAEGLANIGSLVRELQSSVNEINAGTSEARREGISREDIDALETLMQNTKAKIDDHIIPSLESAVTKDDLDGVEAVVRITGDTVDGLTSKLEETLASKDDVAAVFQSVQNAESAMKDLKEDNLDKPSKADIDALENLCDDIKLKLETLPPSEMLPTKDDMEHLTTLMERVKKNHESFKTQYDSDVEITAKAFDDRKEESQKIFNQFDELKDCVAAAKEDIKSRLKRSNEDVRALDEILQAIEDKVGEANAVSDVQEVLEVVNREFDSLGSTMEKANSENDERAEKIQSVLDDLSSKLNSQFSEVLDRHDQQRGVIEQAADAIAGKSTQQDALLSESRAMAEELKITIDTLGGAITSLAPTLKEATDKMGDDAKTVYNRVEDMHGRMDANHVDAMTENQRIRQEVSKSVSNIGVLHDAILKFQPQAMASLSNLLAMVAEHYEHSKTMASQPRDNSDTASIHETIRSGFASLPIPSIEAPPPAMSRDNDERLHGKLEEVIAAVRSDETKVESKLNELMSSLSGLHPTTAIFDKIEDIHQQVQSTASEVSAFLAEQGRLVTDQQDSAVRQAQEAAENLKIFTKESEEMEFKIANLKETRQSLAADVESLMADRDSLTSQKARLAAEVSSLETALQIRKEELNDMDARAEGLERRIIERMMDQSRATLLSRQPRGIANMNLKRVTSTTSTATVSTATPSSVANNAFNLAMNRKRSNRRSTDIGNNPAARRILSLNQITSNVPTGSSVTSARPSPAFLSNMKRSQSVKNPAIRPRASWTAESGIAEYNKENDTFREEESDDDDDEKSVELNSRPETSLTERSISRTGSNYSHSEHGNSNGTGPSEVSYMTDSYMTGSDTMRTSSVGSTIRSVVGGASFLDDAIDEADEEEEQPEGLHSQELEYQDELADTVAELGQCSIDGDAKDLIIRGPDGYDSGLGSDLPTAAAMSQHGSDYFLPVIKHGEDD